jgi:hypothetical protein
MSSVVDPQPEPTPADDLVAYLDGELPPEDCRRVEQRLANDAEYRQQLHDLDQAWEALEALPNAKATDDFARTTMELVAVAAEGEASKVVASTTSARRSRMWWQIAAGAAVMAMSFAIARAVLPDPNRRLLPDLPVIRQMEALQFVPNIEFLRELSAAVPAEDLMSDEKAAKKELSQIALVSGDSFEARRRWIESQTSDQKAQLASQAQRFGELSRYAGRQEQLRDLEREIRKDDDAKRLQKTLVAYGQWLDGLSAGRREQLREDMFDLPVDEQVDLVREFVRMENAQASRELSDADKETLRHELMAIAKERQESFVRDMRRRGEGRRAEQLEGTRGALMILTRELMRDGGNDELREQLVRKLSPAAQEHLDDLNGWRRRVQLWSWVRDCLQAEAGPEVLERFFASDKLDNDQREKLLNMPADEMQSRLERLYYATEFGYGDAAVWWNELPEGGDERMGPRGRGEFRSDGPPRERERGPGPPREFFEGEGRPPGPGGPRGPAGPRGRRDEEFRDGRRPPPDRRGQPPGEPPPGPPQGPPPRKEI